MTSSRLTAEIFVVFFPLRNPTLKRVFFEIETIDKMYFIIEKFICIEYFQNTYHKLIVYIIFSHLGKFPTNKLRLSVFLFSFSTCIESGKFEKKKAILKIIPIDLVECQLDEIYWKK